MVPQQRFVRTRRAEIFTQCSQKRYRPYYSKGRVFAVDDPQHHHFRTRPFGWNEAEWTAVEREGMEE